jgi:hypothetical protein
MRMDFPSAAERDRVIKDYGADKGLAQTLTRLNGYVSANVDERVRAASRARISQ